MPLKREYYARGEKIGNDRADKLLNRQTFRKLSPDQRRELAAEIKCAWLKGYSDARCDARRILSGTSIDHFWHEITRWLRPMH